MASEIRVDKINSLSGVGTVTLSPTGVDIAGITTAATLRATTGIVTSLTAGSLTSLGAVSGTTGTFSGAVSGTTGTFTGDVDIADTIVHTGDTNTKIRFPAADKISFECGGEEILKIGASTTELLRISGPIDGSTQQEFGIGIAVNDQHTHPAAQITFKEYDASDSRGDLLFYTRGANSDSAPTERVRITSGGDLLLGTTTAAVSGGVALMIADSAGGRIKLCDSDLGVTATDGFELIASDNGTAYVWNRENMPILFGTNNSEKLRIDSSGNIIVNDTTADGNVHPDTKLHVKGGITFRELTSASEGALPAITQWSSDGVGQDLAIGTRSAGGDVLFFTGNTGTDGDWGDSSNAEKLRITADGLTFNGDTAAANALDDYEEGTFTPAYTEGSGGGNMLNNVTYNNTTGFYTKIGGCVTFSLRIQCSSHTVIGGHVKITGLPYAAGTTNGKEGGAFFNYSQAVDTSNSGYRPTMHISNSSTQIQFYTSNGNAFYAGAGGTNWNLTLHITGVYHTF